MSLSDVQYSWAGKQFSRHHGKHAKNKAKGFVQTRIGQVSIPTAGLVINGLTSRVRMRSGKENGPRSINHACSRRAAVRCKQSMADFSLMFFSALTKAHHPNCSVAVSRQ